MQVSEMRKRLKSAPKYNQTAQASATWHAKVSSMSENQVIAVYFRMMRAGELRK